MIDLLPSANDLALFLDFDGTLVDIAETPDAVSVADGLIGQLHTLRKITTGALAIVSGRPLAELDYFLPGLSGAMAGSHGLEIRYPDGQIDPASSTYGAIVQQMAAKLVPFAQAHPDVLVEDKPGSLALHYRQNPVLRDACSVAIEAVAPEGWDILDGKMVFEVRPAKISKADAVSILMQAPEFAGRKPVFIGDDETDEDGISMAQQMGGIGVKVGSLPTVAVQNLPDVAAVHTLLVDLLRVS